MTKYASEHTDALADVAEAGEAVTFTQTLPGTYDPATDTWTSPTTATVSGDAIEVEGDMDEYQVLELIARNPATLFFVPDTYGATPAIGASCSWGSVTRTVKARRPVAPDGTAIAWTVVLAI